MSLNPGTSLGHYDVTSLLGEGGMGQVWQATDTQLNRQVALKILPDAFADDPDRLARFKREAQILASLNHPNIAAIHGIEESEGTRALVLELVEGPTLADRISQGPIPLDEALPIARQIAEALEAAHEAGVIHRDLKPANIKVREDGTVKVLDFGLAKALDPSPDGDPSQSPTLTAAATQMGVILGTAAYMSPEQARGKTVDRRTDIWAFGCVLFEMLTGERVFQGEDVSLTLAEVMKTEPAWDALPSDSPVFVRRVLRRCMEKDPRRRLRDIGDGLAEIEEALRAPEAERAGPREVRSRVWYRTVSVSLAVVVASALTGGLTLWVTRSDEGTLRPPTRLSINLTTIDELSVGPGPIVATSPDGTQVVFVGRRDGVDRLYRRPLGQLEASLIPGTGGARTPFFSPDGEWVGFVADAQLKRVPVRGGPVVVVCAAPGFVIGARWADDDTIVFGDLNGGLSQVVAAGGTPRPLTTLDPTNGEVGHLTPELLPGGTGTLFTVLYGAGRPPQIDVQSLETGARSTLVEGTSPRFAPPGHLVFQRAGALWAVSFDPDRLELTGAPTIIVDSVQVSEPFATATQYALVGEGGLIYVPSAPRQSTLVWVDRSGQTTPLIDEHAWYGRPRLSPDGTRVAYQVLSETGQVDLWVVDQRGSRTRLTASGVNQDPVWGPDGNWIAFGSYRSGDPELYRKRADGTGEVELLLAREGNQSPHSWSSYGLAFYERDDSGPLPSGYGAGRDILVLPREGDRTPSPIVVTPANERSPSFSPDGRWLAYVSNESGRDEIYVQPYPGPGERVTVSTDGGLVA